MTVSRRLLTVAVDTRLKTLTGVTVYLGEVPAKVPVIGDGTGRAAPYLVQYPSPGRPVDEETDLGDAADDLAWQTQLTCAAGYVEDLANLVDRVHGLLFRWRPAVPGLVTGGFRPPPGYDPGPSRRDDDVSPPRHFLPLIYRIDTTIT